MLPALLLLLLAATPSEPASLTGPARDPFLGPAEVKDAPCDVPGLHCVSWQRVKVTAIVTAPTGVLATLQAGDGESWLAREGDRLRNAVVVSIDPDRRGVLLREPVPGTVAGFREIVLVPGQDVPTVREPLSVEPELKVPQR